MGSEWNVLWISCTTWRKYSVMYSQQECISELIICVIHPGIPSLLNYGLLIQYKFAFHCFWWPLSSCGWLKIPFQEFPLTLYSIWDGIIDMPQNLGSWSLDIQFIHYLWSKWVLSEIQIRRKSNPWFQGVYDLIVETRGAWKSNFRPQKVL